MSLSILVTLLFDGIVLGLMVVDSLTVQRYRVQITRQFLPRLSIGRDNPVVIAVKLGKRPATIQICDYYPTQFAVSTPALSTSLPANSNQELTYTVHPNQRGEFSWGDIQVRQLRFWGLAWDDWKIPKVRKSKFIQT